jgi:heme/copper-type cytochrome/quinol oxidase subunit 2
MRHDGVNSQLTTSNSHEASMRTSFVRAISAAVVTMLLSGSSVLACPMCFGAEETSMVDGTKIGVLVMLAITLAVQGGFVGFFFYLRKRAKRFAGVELDEEWSHLQRAPRTS